MIMEFKTLFILISNVNAIQVVLVILGCNPADNARLPIKSYKK